MENNLKADALEKKVERTGKTRTIEGILVGATESIFYSSYAPSGTRYEFKTANGKIETYLIENEFTGVTQSLMKLLFGNMIGGFIEEELIRGKKSIVKKGDRIRITETDEYVKVKINSYWLRIPKHSYKCMKSSE